MLTLYRSLIELRRRTPALAVGSYQGIPADGDLLVYRREHAGERFLIALNLGHRSQELALGELAGRVVVSTHLDRDDEVGSPLALGGNEGVVIELRRRSNHQNQQMQDMN
jgi:alpha-glucosidase